MRLPDDVQGALVTQVAEGSAAARAGIEVSDVINSRARTADQEQFRTAQHHRHAEGRRVRQHRPAAGGQAEDRDSRAARSRCRSSNAESIHPALAGAELVEVAEDAAGGISIRSVAPGSPAAQAGLLADDRIIAVNRQRVSTLAQLREVSERPGLDARAAAARQPSAPAPAALTRTGG